MQLKAEDEERTLRMVEDVGCFLHLAAREIALRLYRAEAVGFVGAGAAEGEGASTRSC